MPRRLLCTVLLAGLLLPALSPAVAAEVVAHVGVNASTFHMDDLSSDAREGLAAGVSVRLPISANFALMPEVWYMQKGFKRGKLWDQIDLESKLQTITVPLLLNYRFLAVSADPRIFAGLAVDFVLKDEINRRDDDAGWLDVTDQDESIYWSLVLGGGARLFGWFDVDIRYQHGLTKVTNFDYVEFDDVIPSHQEFDDAFDRTWTLSVGYWF